eukprot:315731-Pyramimonas_sp.AAC.2
MDPVDWRYREFNVAADRAATCCLAQGFDIALLDQTHTAEKLGQAAGLQVFWDGSSTGQRASAAMVLHAVLQGGKRQLGARAF